MTTMKQAWKLALLATAELAFAGMPEAQREAALAAVRTRVEKLPKRQPTKPAYVPHEGFTNARRKRAIKLLLTDDRVASKVQALVAERELSRLVRASVHLRSGGKGAPMRRGGKSHRRTSAKVEELHDYIVSLLKKFPAWPPGRLYEKADKTKIRNLTKPRFDGHVRRVLDAKKNSFAV